MSRHELVLRLRAIRYGCDFRKSDTRLYSEFQRDRNFPGLLEPGECYLFIAQRENQLLWLLQQQHTENSKGWPVTFTDTRRWRFSGTTKWDPLALRHYAKQAGIILRGIGQFAPAYEAQRTAVKLAAEERAERRRLVREQADAERERLAGSGAGGSIAQLVPDEMTYAAQQRRRG